MGSWELGPDDGQVKKSWREVIAQKAAEVLVGPVEPMLGSSSPKSKDTMHFVEGKKQPNADGRFVFEHDEIHHLSITENKHIVVGVDPCDIQERDVIELHPFGGHIVMLVNYLDEPKANADGRVLIFAQGWPITRGV